MKPRTVYEKAVQDFTETARQLARLNQHFRQASFGGLAAMIIGQWMTVSLLALILWRLW